MAKNEKGKSMKVIEPTKSPVHSKKEKHEKLRVAAYARVSSETDEQENSFENQREYFMWLIESNPNYIFSGLYADEGITGTSTKNRDGFNQMIEDALDGQFDLIMVKSISRFGRNTLDTLNACRALKNADIDVFFEKENIHILDQAGELLLTIFSSLAQEESRSISENIKMGIRAAYKRGSYRIHFSQYIGYDKLENGTLQINDDAWIIRYLYLLFYEGNSFHNIATILNTEGLIRPNGQGIWTRDNVKAIFFNEIYCGDVLLQKTYVKNYLDHRVVKNNGVLPQYYVFDDHKPIIPRELFYYTQNQYNTGKGIRYDSYHHHAHGTVSLSSKLICENCRCAFGSRIGHSTDKYRFEFFRCIDFYKGTNCNSTTIRREALETLFIDVLGELNGDSYREIFDLIIKETDPQKVTAKMLKKADKITELRHTIEVTPPEATEYISSIRQKLTKAESDYERLKKEKERLEALCKNITDIYNKELFSRKFDIRAYNVLLEHILVSRNELTFVFRNGSELTRSYNSHPQQPLDTDLFNKIKEKEKSKHIKQKKQSEKEHKAYCRNCGKSFNGTKGQLFCSAKCHDEFLYTIIGDKS